MTNLTSNYPTNAFINGCWQPAKNGNTFAVTNPSTGEHLANVSDCAANEIRQAIVAANESQAKWANQSALKRSHILRKWRDLMCEQSEALGQVLMLENGKPLSEAIGEVLYGASYLEWFSEEAKRVYGDVIPSSSNQNRVLVIKQPIGVCAAITPWNFPNAMLMRKAAAALAAGCTIIAKPAAETPLSALLTAKLAADAGIPAGVFNVVPSSNPAIIGNEMTTNPLVRKISFTGSTEIGRMLLSKSAQTIKKVSMELGGNAPFIVFDDANLDAAIEGAMASKFRNAGQTCVCSNRFFIQDTIFEEFANRLVERVAKLKVGDGQNPQSQIGPLINAKGLAKTERLVQSAISAGAKLRTGGARHNAGPLFYQPTVLEQVTTDMDVAREEIFGPVVPLIRFDTEDEVIRLANDSIFGLAAYLYTQNLGRAWRVGEALEYGMVGINEGIISAAQAPFGGIKQSGLGREGSHYGLEDYLETKYLLMGGLDY